MLPISPDWMTQTVTVWMLISVRLLGCFMAMPLFAFRSAPMRLRVLLSLVIAFALVPLVQDNLPPLNTMPPGYAMVFVIFAPWPLIFWVRHVMPQVKSLGAWIVFPVVMYSCFWAILGPVDPGKFPYSHRQVLQPAVSD